MKTLIYLSGGDSGQSSDSCPPQIGKASPQLIHQAAKRIINCEAEDGRTCLIEQEIIIRRPLTEEVLSAETPFKGLLAWC